MGVHIKCNHIPSEMCELYYFGFDDLDILYGCKLPYSLTRTISICRLSCNAIDYDVLYLSISRNDGIPKTRVSTDITGLLV